MYKQCFCAVALASGFAIAGLGLTHSRAVPAEDCPSSGNPLVEVADGIHVREGQHGTPFVDRNFANVGFIIGEQCVAVIDSGSDPEEGEALRCAIERTTDVPVCFVIVTHHHFDHALGNRAFKAEGVTFIGHEKQARGLAGSADFYIDRLSELSGKQLGKDIIVPPDRTVSIGEPMSLDLGDRVLTLTAHRTAHTDNDLSVMDERTSTLWLSDLLFVEHIPTLDGSVLGWLNVMKTLEQQSAARAIPGHGPVQVAWPAAMAPQREYFRVLRDESRALIAAGGSLQKATESIGLDQQPLWVNFDLHHRRNVTAVFTELEWE